LKIIVLEIYSKLYHPHRYDFELFDYDIQEYLQVARPDEAESPAAGTKK